MSAGMPFARVLLSSPSPDRILYLGRRPTGDTSPRRKQLIPRLQRLDRFMTRVSERRILRGAQTRLLSTTARQRNWLIFAAANRRYRLMFATNYEQIPYFEGRVVVDVDDPRFSPEEVDLLNRPNVVAYVVTTESARSRLEDLGVRTPGHVIPQGVDLGAFDERKAAQVAARHRRNGELTMGYVARWVLADPNGKGDHGLNGIRHLLELWDQIHARVPNARLWLIGAPDAAMREISAAREDILLLGRIPQEQVPCHVANFDIALFPRRIGTPMPVKLAEYIGLGVPTVSYDLELARILREHGAGSVARTPEEFVNQVETLSRDQAVRDRMAAAARRLAPRFDWATLAHTYQTEVLDRYLR